MLVDDRARDRPEAAPLEERAVVVSAQEAGFLALWSGRGGQTCAGRLDTSLALRLLAEREPQPAEQARIEPREHVGLILVRIRGAGQEQPAVALDDAGVMARRQLRRSSPAREGAQLCEAEAAVARRARIRCLAPRISMDERVDDHAPEFLTQVERDVRQPTLVAGSTRREHRLGRAAGAFRVGRLRVDPEAKRDADCLGPRA